MTPFQVHVATCLRLLALIPEADLSEAEWTLREVLSRGTGTDLELFWWESPDRYELYPFFDYLFLGPGCRTLWIWWIRRTQPGIRVEELGDLEREAQFQRVVPRTWADYPAPPGYGNGWRPGSEYEEGDGSRNVDGYGYDDITDGAEAVDGLRDPLAVPSGTGKGCGLGYGDSDGNGWGEGDHYNPRTDMDDEPGLYDDSGYAPY
jgi:hypothetical protein